jgi:hypothetical protein
MLSGCKFDREQGILRSSGTDLPSWAEGLAIDGIHAFGRGWTAQVTGGAVTVAVGN